MRSFSDIFSSSQLSYLAVLGQSNFDNEPLEKLHKDVPAEFKEYRFLMHPSRLSIMKILYKNFVLSSVELKNQLKLSWGEYSSHISALEKRGFILSETKFVNGIKANVIYLEEIGRKEFENLINLLEDFLVDVKHDYFDDHPNRSSLYPTS